MTNPLSRPGRPGPPREMQNSSGSLFFDKPGASRSAERNQNGSSTFTGPPRKTQDEAAKQTKRNAGKAEYEADETVDKKTKQSRSNALK